MNCFFGNRRRQAVLLLPLLLAWLFCATASSTSASSLLTEDQLFAVARAAVEADDIQPIREIELQSIPAAQGRAVRTDSMLSLQLGSGARRVFEDRPECRPGAENEARCEQYLLVGYLDRHGMILMAHLLYEDLRFILLNGKSGRETEFDGLPLFSPSGKYVLVLDNDVNSELEVQIFQRRGETFRLASKGTPNNDGQFTVYRLEDWQEDGVITLQAETYNQPNPDILRTFVLRQMGRQWAVSTP